MLLSWFLEQMQSSVDDHCFLAWMQNFELKLVHVSGTDLRTIGLGQQRLLFVKPVLG